MRHVILAGILLAGSGCARAPAEGERARTGAATAPSNAPVADAEGMCSEHGVLEAVCPKCNPALATVFQAKGDWCAEHGFPESFCPICHPELGGRPAVDVSTKPGDGAPADGTKVRFKTRETARLAGIETVAATEALREAGVTAVVRVVYDASKLASVSAPAPGIVSGVRADVGARVRRGDPLATIQSATVGAGRAQEEAARSRVAAANVSLERQRDLLAAGVTSVREVQEAEQALSSANAELAALESQLGMVGGGSAGTYALVAPLSGEVTRRDVSIGMSVEGGAPLFEIVDASTMWAEVDVAERDLPLVAVANKVTIVLDTFPDRTFEGTIAYIAPTVSVETRTALARVELDNADRVLRGNMYGTARIAVTNARPTVTVPAAAVQNAKGVNLVFVRLAEDEFEARRVVVASRQGDEVRLAEGVVPGEVVVTSGSFMLKTETLKDSIGAGCCDVE